MQVVWLTILCTACTAQWSSIFFIASTITALLRSMFVDKAATLDLLLAYKRRCHNVDSIASACSDDEIIYHFVEMVDSIAQVGDGLSHVLAVVLGLGDLHRLAGCPGSHVLQLHAQQAKQSLNNNHYKRNRTCSSALTERKCLREHETYIK